MIKIQDKEFYKKLVSLALPIALQGLISSSLTLLDNLMVSKLGELSLTAVGLATQSFTIEWMVIFGFCSGCGTFFTQFWGVKDIKNVRKVIGIAEMTCFAASLVFFIAGFFFPVQVLSLLTNSNEAAVLGADYLRYAAVNFILVALTQPFLTALRVTEQTKIPMYISLSSFFVDVIFNYLLIFGNYGFPKLGVKGAAIATVMARTLELILTIYVVFIKKNIISGKLKEYFNFNRRYIKRVYSNAFATTMNELMWSSAVVAQNAAYGHISVTAYAAVQATATIMDLFQMACFSIGDASLIVVGEHIGRNELDEAKKVSRKYLKISLIVSLFVAALLIIVRKPIVSLFTLSELGVLYARRLVIIRALYIPANLQSAILLAGIFRAGGDAKFAAITEIATMWLIAVPLAFLGALVFKLPVYWVMVMVQAETVLKLTLMYRRYFSGKWLKNMITGM